MSAITAKEEMGFCTCGVLIEPGERVFLTNGNAIHVGCPPRQTESKTTITQSQSPGFLFNDMELKTVEDARQTVGASRVVFDGASAMGIDVARLAGQLAKVFNLMRDGKFRTLEVVAEATGCLETSASARLRDLRKARFGAHQVITRQVENSPGLYEYKLVVNQTSLDKRGQQVA